MMCELVHLRKQCETKEDAARFTAETFVESQLRMETGSVRANGSDQERLLLRNPRHNPQVPNNATQHDPLRPLRIVEQPSLDHPIGHGMEGTPTGETSDRVPTRVGPEGEAQLPCIATLGGVEWYAVGGKNAEKDGYKSAAESKSHNNSGLKVRG